MGQKQRGMSRATLGTPAEMTWSPEVTALYF